MKESLVGYTGFVGSNIRKSHEFHGLYHSKNIKEAYGTRPDLLVYSGVRAEKFLANKEPEQDYQVVKAAFENIEKIQPKRIVLISTIDVYKEPVLVDESSEITTENLHPYGKNRYFLEQWVREYNREALIVRLPALYGDNLKKNFIYDMIHLIPMLLTEEKFKELNGDNNILRRYYIRGENGFYQCRKLDESENAKLKEFFQRAGFTALQFTDERAVFQFYPLRFLWQHIETALMQGIRLLNLATEPVSAKEVYHDIRGEEFINFTGKQIPFYDYRTKYDKIFHGQNGYLFDKKFILEDLNRFVSEQEICQNKQMETGRK